MKHVVFIRINGEMQGFGFHEEKNLHSFIKSMLDKGVCPSDIVHDASYQYEEIKLKRLYKAAPEMLSLLKEILNSSFDIPADIPQQKISNLIDRIEGR